MTVFAKPVAVDDSHTVYESDFISGNLLDNDIAAANGNMFLNFFDGERVLAKQDGQVTDIEGGHGTFHVKADGSYTYTLSEAAKAGFIDGMTLTETIGYKISDGAGNTDVGHFTLDIHGVTSPPVAVDDAFSFREGSEIAGNVLANDHAGEAGTLFLRSVEGTNVGTGERQTTDVAGEFGTFHFSADGSFTYNLDPAVKAGLNDGEHVTEKLQYYKVSDGAGHADAGVISLTIDGVTDGKSLNTNHVEAQADVVRPFLDHYELQGVAVDPQTGKFYVSSGHGFPDDSMVYIYDNAAAFEADNASGAISLGEYDRGEYDIGGTYFAVRGGEIIGRTNEARGEGPFPDQTYLAKWDAADGSLDQQGDPIPGLIGDNGAGTFDWGGFTAVNTMQDSTGIYVVGRIDDATWQVSKIDPDTLSPIESKTFSAGGLGYGFAVDGTFFFGDSFGSEHIGTAFDFETGVKTAIDVNIAISGDDSTTNVAYDAAADSIYITNSQTDEISVVHNISDILFA
ncbi:outer membrane adhesin like protein [Rhizobium leguminosarum bv. trifolii WSM2304]|uniref:Outer membrane adhesin like protein n=1 Tax=Rhizobium leguminosarum bv. trifolii (strain WSM2304) TaxID=395492 RepID=A0ABF7QN49_RHILW|nr:Ig-like domain-containing protein [Rhizobium leguminosarum]ACI55561.1 outer membrane adhesin like protein [Rhizobium leguminosarum bv. trifolii WSM2304]